MQKSQQSHEKKSHESECLYIARAQEPHTKEVDYFIITLVHLPYQPHEVNRVRLALMRKEDKESYLTFTDVYDEVRTLKWSGARWLEDNPIGHTRRIALTTPEGTINVRELIFANTLSDLNEYLAKDY